MKLYLTLTRKRLFLVICITALLIGVCGRFSAVKGNAVDGSTNAKRVSFAQYCGCKVEETAETVKNIRIPQNFSKVYENYNKLQQRAGFDLSLYKGCEVTLYSYKVLEGGIAGQQTLINIIVYRGRIIGGDISSVELDGDMLPLEKLKYPE